MSLLWQIVRVYLYSSIHIVHCKELLWLLEPGESETILAIILPEEVLIRWLRYHLKAAGIEMQERNFSEMKVLLAVPVLLLLFTMSTVRVQ